MSNFLLKQTSKVCFLPPLLLCEFLLREVEFFSRDLFVELEAVDDRRLEVRRRVVPLGDEAPVCGGIVHGLAHLGDVEELFLDGSQKRESRSQLRDGIVRLDGGAHESDELPLGGNVMCVRAAEDVHVALASSLALRHDDLHAVAVSCVRDGVVHEADGPDNLVAHACLLRREVRRVSDDELARGCGPLGRDSARLSTCVVRDGHSRLVEHVRSSVDG
mmetsp:Transcript_4061/g.9081  ORF Transcript_4061/g.9081 Transcript_4061/m.9081 type:complete len:218 (-) Transcript_4061:706-1359(-)